jgi:PAP2 superfamily
MAATAPTSPRADSIAGVRRRAAAVHFPRVTVLRTAALELALWISVYGLYLLVRGISIADADEALANARGLIEAERSLGLFHEERLQDALAPLHQVLSAYYMLGFAPLLVGVLVWLLLRHPDAYRELRTVLLLSLVFASMAYVMLPTAPPRLVPGLGIADTVGLSVRGEEGSFSGIRFNPYAAMPSMHVGWSVLIGLFAFRMAPARSVRIFFAAHPAVMAIAVTATGNHFFLDSLVGAGLALATLGLWRVRHVPRRPRLPCPQPCPG